MAGGLSVLWDGREGRTYAAGGVDYYVEVDGGVGGEGGAEEVPGFGGAGYGGVDVEGEEDAGGENHFGQVRQGGMLVNAEKNGVVSR